MKPIVRLSALLLILTAACERGAELPSSSSESYDEAVAEFYSGIAALQAGEAGLAESSFRRVTELAPGEPGGWADLALTMLGRRQPESAATAIGRALELAPDHPRVSLIAALIARDRGLTDEAVNHLRTAIGPDSANVRAAFLLVQLLEREGGPESLDAARRLMDRILAASPGNLLALLEQARLAALQGASQDVLDTLDRLEQVAGVVEAAGPQLQAVRDAVATGPAERAATEIARLETRLQPLAVYRDDRDALRIAAGGAEVMLTSFVRLAMPQPRSEAPDLDVAFVPESLSVGEGPWDWVRGLWLGDEIPMALVAANPRQIGVGVSLDRVELFDFPGDGSGATLPAAAMAFLDYDYDFAADLAFAGPGGIRLIRQASIGTFVDVTDQAIPASVVGGDYAGVWAADLDMEGDMDLVVARTDGEPLVLWNQGDDRFEPGAEFSGVSALRALAWADLDADGDPDATLIDASGRVHVFTNRRFRVPRFERRPLPDSLGQARAVAVADLDRDAVLDLVLLHEDGTVRQVSVEGAGWRSTVLTRWPGFEAPDVGHARLFLSDLDNNGDLDLLVSDAAAAQAWLSTPDGLRPQQTVEARVTDVADLSGEGRLDLVAVGAAGMPALYTNQGGRDYYSTTIRPRAARAVGDRRINSFGIGGEIEIRAGALYQKKPISDQTVHFGLGDHAELDVARITWPNGMVQAEFDVPATNEAVTALQRLKGSCPWVFAHDGSGVRFVTDFLWRTALGLRINAQGDASVIHAEDWIRIRGDQLAPRDGLYDVRITGELWESHFFDQVSLLAVDHPEQTEVFVDERFTLPAPEPAVRVMGPLRSVESARDQEGRDVSDLVAELDERYLDTFELGPYQGLAEEHHVEVDLGPAADTTGPLWLVASGWVYPTDGSINFALAQAGRPGPRGLRIEVPDGRGGWTAIEEDFGFPAGKTKTILIDLTDVFRTGAPRRVRLGTNMEVYWDRLAWAVGRADTIARTQRLSASSAELRYRGFSQVHAASRRAPEIPDYDRIGAVTPIWRDLIGFHTRFGDVRPLIEDVDDRYVIMNAGDEMALRFPAPAPPPDGWVRDFVLIGDGWVKDGDLNNGFSETLMPLPYHGLEDYDRPPRRLEDDPAYHRHPDDWRVYHTRYVTPEPFQRALLPSRTDPPVSTVPPRSETPAAGARR